MKSLSTLPKAKSITTSSASSTNSGSTSVQYVKGVGPRLGAIFKSRGIETVRDLLYFFPRSYEDRSRLYKVADLSKLPDGQKASVAVKVFGSRKIQTRYGKSILEVRAGDNTGTLYLKWFHVHKGMEQRFVPGASFIVTGAVKKFISRPEMIHPEVATPDAEMNAAHQGRVVPVYTEIEEVPTRTLRKILWEALEKYASQLTEDLPERYLKQHGLPLLPESIREIHFPAESGEKSIQDHLQFNTPAHWRLIYEEFFKFEYLVLKQRIGLEKHASSPFGASKGHEALRALEKKLPFTLTRGQSAALNDILGDISQPHPMNRLIQGDVGCGKTAVAFLSASCVLAEGAQVALMAPTEILAEQHYRNAMKLFGGALRVELLTGKTTPSERSSLLEQLRVGAPLLLIGTHALIEDPVEFKNLALVMIDEQHRFGVEQRRTLRNKGLIPDAATGKPRVPHILILTATPIPRTLALTAYGDLAVTSILELPPGRQPITTKVARDSTERARAYETIRKELKAGHQAYFIYPLVNESEAEGFTQLKAVVTEAEHLASEIFPEFRVGLLHGQLKSDEKANVMERFARNDIQVLVSTTVVEVGVDVPNATVITIEHAERFGLSQLHQLRGRVGRGNAPAFCFLFSHPHTGETATQRLDVLEETTDGFKIAEADLEIRGPGEFLGTRQSGGLPFRLANLVRDREWLLKARDDAASLLKEDPDLMQPHHLRLKRYYEREGNLQFERLKTS